jgi:two-component system response regulator HydG
MVNRRMLVLVVDDEPTMREILEIRLSSWGFDVLLAEDAESAGRLAEEERPDVVISDVVLPGISGIELLGQLKAGDPERPVILITAHGTIDHAVEAMKRGADDFLTKPIDHDDLHSTLDAVAENLADRARTRGLEDQLQKESGAAGLVGRSPAMQDLFGLIRTVAASDASVLISGESGTGKELVARAIHAASARRDGPFVAVNCAAVPEQLTESHFFGHEKGAFTGADRRRQGSFELAEGGTLLLDEIAEMPVALQPKLLRVLEEGSVRRVGGGSEIPFSVRVIAATNRDPQRAVEEGSLREDLFYRLSVFPLAIPPLRERPEDVPLLAQHFVRLFNEKHDVSVTGFTSEAEARLRDHDWPGNVRELRNAIERAVILARSGWVEDRHLPPAFTRRRVDASVDGLVVPENATIADAERLLILSTLERVENNKAEAARILGVDVKTIRNKLHRYRTENGAE